MHAYRKIVSIMNRENSNVEEITINNKVLKFTIVNDRCSDRSLDKENCCNKVIGLMMMTMGDLPNGRLFLRHNWIIVPLITCQRVGSLRHNWIIVPRISWPMR